DGGPHGIEDWTADYSGCGRSVNYPYTGNPSTSMQVPNWALRDDTYYWAVDLSKGHAEQVWLGAMFGDAKPSRGFHVRSHWGAPNPFTNVWESSRTRSLRSTMCRTSSLTPPPGRTALQI